MESTIHESTVNDLTFEGPATYRIRIKGLLDDHWTDRLGGMAIRTTWLGEHETVTTLCGQVLDQAELFGVLNTLYDLLRSLSSKPTCQHLHPMSPSLEPNALLMKHPLCPPDDLLYGYIRYQKDVQRLSFPPSQFTLFHTIIYSYRREYRAF